MIELRKVSVHYGKVEALKDVSIKAEEGAIVSLIGSNGAGKSTILRAISGLVPVSSGEILFNSKKINGWQPDKIAKLGIAHIPEGKRLFYRLSVFKNLQSGAFSRKDPAEIKNNMQRTYSYFPVLERKRDKPAKQLSGGEQQMLAVGRGILSNAKVLLIDEPSVGLAPILVKEVGDHIKKLANEGAAVILVEQNAVLALNISKRAYVLVTGRITMEGDSKELQGSEAIRKAYLGL